MGRQRGIIIVVVFVVLPGYISPVPFSHLDRERQGEMTEQKKREEVKVVVAQEFI